MLPAPHRPGSAGIRAWAASLTLMVVVTFGLLAFTAPTASAHVVPTSSISLAIQEKQVEAVVSIPLADLEAASGIDLGNETQTEVDSRAAAVRNYLLAHVAPTTDAGQAWSVTLGDLSVAETGNAETTGRYQQLQTTFTLTPPDGSTTRSFNLGDDLIVHRVATHVTIVTVTSDWEAPDVSSAYEIGTVQRDTVTNTVQALHVDLGSGSTYRGFLSMVRLGLQHIEAGTDHQLFLLTLLLPAPLLARARRWSGPVTARLAVRRIATITLSFTLGHSATLALGVLGLPVPQRTVEVLIAVSILVAALHAIRPIFPGREALVAALFGLVHGLAFSATLRELDLTGLQLVSSLLGFNLGIEIMQLIVVAATLPPLILLARAGRYRALRVTAAAITAAAAVGWIAARLGFSNPVADLADRLGSVSVPVIITLWLTALILTARLRRWWSPPSGRRRSR